MGFLDFIGEKKKQKEEIERKRIENEENLRKAEQQRITQEAEKKRLLEIEQAKNREARALLTANDEERFSKGASWMLNNKEPILKAAIVKIGRETKDHYYSTPYNIKIGDHISFEDESDMDDDGNDKSKIIVSYKNDEIGELSKAVREKLEDYDIDSLIGIVIKVDNNDDLKVTASVFEGSEFAEPGYRQLNTIIIGTKYENSDGTSRQEYLSREFYGNRVKLVKSEYNGDPAVKVCTARDFQLGFLKAELAKEFCNRIDRNEIGGIYISKISAVDGIKYCDIVINIANF